MPKIQPDALFLEMEAEIKRLRDALELLVRFTEFELQQLPSNHPIASPCKKARAVLDSQS